MRLPFVLALALGVLLGAREAHALGPVDVEAGGRVGYATQPVGATHANPFGLALGVGAGLSVHGVYLGISAMHHFGVDVGRGYQSTLIGGELGYEWKPLRFFVLRPQLGIGNAFVYFEEKGYPTTSQNALYLEPSVTGLFLFGPVFAGADLGTLVLPSITQGDGAEDAERNVTGRWFSVTTHVRAGIRF